MAGAIEAGRCRVDVGQHTQRVRPFGRADARALAIGGIHRDRVRGLQRILVIEHDRALRKILQRLFSSEGYEVDVAPNGVAGLEMLRQRPPSVVVLDLPYAESPSSDLCRKIAHLTPGLPLVILSASSDVAHKVLLLEMGAADYVSIPFSPRELVDRLRALTRRASRG